MITLTATPILQTERLVLRAPQAGDWPVWRDFYLAERSHGFRPAPEPTPEQAWRAFAAITGHWVLRGWGMFVLTRREDGAAIGAIGPWMPEGWPEPEIAWSIWAAQAEGKGYAAEAARAVITHAFRDLNWPSAVSYIDPNNIRSTALAERLGARRDPQAAFPGEPPIVVWRHPNPQEEAA